MQLQWSRDHCHVSKSSALFKVPEREAERVCNCTARLPKTVLSLLLVVMACRSSVASTLNWGFRNQSCHEAHSGLTLPEVFWRDQVRGSHQCVELIVWHKIAAPASMYCGCSCIYVYFTELPRALPHRQAALLQPRPVPHTQAPPPGPNPHPDPTRSCVKLLIAHLPACKKSHMAESGGHGGPTPRYQHEA
jgi:hypothetical protein